MTETKYTGQCLCGSVWFDIAPPAEKVRLCHCGTCRRWTGGLPSSTVQAVVTLGAEETLSWWESSTWGERGFCNKCGTPLFWRNLLNEAPWAVNVGSLNDQEGLVIDLHISIDKKADFYEFADNAPRLSSVEFIAMNFTNIAKADGDNILSMALQQFEQHADAQLFADVREKLVENGVLPADKN